MLTPADVLREPPFSAVVQHMEIIVQTVERVPPLFVALCNGDDERVAQLCREITDLEEAADQLKNAVRDHLPQAIKLPVSRRDLLTVVSAQDTISDNALKIVWLLEVRRFTVPDQIADLLLTMADMVLEAVRQGRLLCGEVQVLAEARFRGPHKDQAMALIHEIERQEALCDEHARKVLTALFGAEDEIGPVSTVLWYQIIELIGSLADASKKLANRVRLMLAR